MASGIICLYNKSGQLLKLKSYCTKRERKGAINEWQELFCEGDYLQIYVIRGIQKGVEVPYVKRSEMDEKKPSMVRPPAIYNNIKSNYFAP